MTDPIHIHEAAFETTEEVERGVLKRRSLHGGDRYLFDFSVCTRERGWVQYDTDQDAWYFGVWVHEGRLEVVTYAEGDLAYFTARDEASFRAEIEEMNAFYAPSPAFVTIDQGGVTEVFDERGLMGREVE